MQESTFVVVPRRRQQMRALHLRLFLEDGQAGGVWADFGLRGHYATSNPAHILKIRNSEEYKTGIIKEINQPRFTAPTQIFKCTECGATENVKGEPFENRLSVRVHLLKTHGIKVESETDSRIEEVK